MATNGEPVQPKPRFGLPTFRLWHDFGVSALLTTMTTSATMFVAVWALMNDRVEAAKEIIGILGVLTTTFWNGYLTKRKEEKDK